MVDSMDGPWDGLIMNRGVQTLLLGFCGSLQRLEVSENFVKQHVCIDEGIFEGLGGVCNPHMKEICLVRQTFL
jgi:hypothetical protein